VVPGINAHTRQAEIEHLQTWATANNLRLHIIIIIIIMFVY